MDNFNTKLPTKLCKAIRHRQDMKDKNHGQRADKEANSVDKQRNLP